ncbi:MAG TPA: DUF1499 domain-containing protein [Nitrospiria bacterium]|nr:DUF1499 domain-containing protein [Nitrospiria bacterium]
MSIRSSVGRANQGGAVPRAFVLAFAHGGCWLAIISLLTLLLAGLGSRWGWWNFRSGFVLLAWGAYGGAAAASCGGAALLLIGLTRERAARTIVVAAAIGLLAGLVAFGIPWQWRRAAQRVPAIHDITTDPDHPPLFVAVLPLRAGAPNPPDYRGPEIAAQQRSAYPEIVPVFLKMPPDRAFALASAAAKGMGWQIVAEAPEEGRIEATDTTLWFGFKDDIVIRVTSSDGGSRIDVRSVSRVGRSDVGTNARRIDAFLKRVTSSG